VGVCGSCNMWVCICVGGCFINCVDVLVISLLVFTVFVLFRLCIFILISFFCTSVRTSATD